ncbi:hypothetical protein TruAng_002397 [Truncatella angustata]|nr:hypothetical protein TruAng_002397 [Truncatella angustata]
MGIFVVTGARRGIGQEYVRQLSDSEENTVIALVRSLSADLTALRDVESHAKGRVHILGCDITSDESVPSLREEVASILKEDAEKIDVIINNAAISNDQGVASRDLSASVLLDHVNSNVCGPARVVQSLLPYLKENGIIANISSGLGSLGLLSEEKIPPHIPSYSISKAALNMLTVHQAYELRGKAIIVSIDPGHVKTDMGGEKAVLEIHDSAGQVLSTLANLKSEDSGKFLEYNGSIVPW